jgi:hypothetical protein
VVAIFVVSLVVVIWSVLRSGYFFTIDIDEYFHAHMTYLLAHGYHPFTDFFTVYSPIFHWLLVPGFSFFGFSLETIQWTRLLLITLLALRVTAGFFLIQLIFSSWVAIVFIPVFFLDPMTPFVGMQIRPDNLMITLFMVSLWILALGFKKKKPALFFAAGILSGLSFVTSVKITPSIVMLVTVFSLHCLHTRDFKTWKTVASGFATVIILFCAYFIAIGAFEQMVRGLFVDSLAINRSLLYPVPHGHYYRPTDNQLYGQSWKPALWIYLWMLQVGSIAGAYTLVTHVLAKKKLQWEDCIKMVLVLSLFIQWFSLFFVRSVFIQYYIPVTWLYALFTAWGIVYLFELLRRWPWVSQGGVALLLGVYAFLARDSVMANVERSGIRAAEVRDGIRASWTELPPNAPVFPGYLFRPLSYPIPYGFTYTDLPPLIFKRYAPIASYLEKQKTPYLFIGDPPWAVPASTASYIHAHYTKISGSLMVWKRR